MIGSNRTFPVKNLNLGSPLSWLHLAHEIKEKLISRFIYATDLHGSELQYETVFNFAIENNISLIHLGADILPKGSNILSIQEKFVKHYLKEFYRRCQEKNIDVLAFFGNDDIYTRKKYFKKYASLLDETPFQKDGFTFSAYPYVMDYPFGLKTACKLDYKGWKHSYPYLGAPVDFTDTGRVVITDVERYFAEKGTIEEDLKKYHATDETIIAIHMPPWSLDLDVCSDGRRVGSKSVFEWIQREQPKLVLCGHIHESPDVTKVWKAELGKTTIIQPGQNDPYTKKTTLVYIEVSDKVAAQRLTL